MDLIRGPTFKTAAASVFIAAFFVPMIVIGIMNIKIVATLKRKNHPSSVSIKFANIRKQVTRTLLILITLFFVLQLPIRSMSALYIIRDAIGKNFLNHAVEQMIVVIGSILLAMNSAINSIVYISVSQHYREGFMEAFGFRPSKRESPSNKAITVPGT